LQPLRDDPFINSGHFDNDSTRFSPLTHFPILDASSFALARASGMRNALVRQLQLMKMIPELRIRHADTTTKAFLEDYRHASKPQTSGHWSGSRG
jgi:hypothetical protein